MFSPTALLGITTSLLPLVLGFSTEIDGHRVETRIHPGNAKDCADLDKKTILEFRGVKADKSFIRLDSGIITACPGNGEDGRDRWLVHQDQTDIVSFRMTFDKKDGQELPEATKVS